MWTITRLQLFLLSVGVVFSVQILLHPDLLWTLVGEAGVWWCARVSGLSCSSNARCSKISLPS